MRLPKFRYAVLCGAMLGVLGYFYKGERKYFAVTSFEKLKPLAYP
jgi:hypothetical protein